MIIKEDIRYFLKHGSLLNIPFGITRAELIEKLGNTENIRYSSPTDTFPSVFIYGRVEFHFAKYKKATFRAIKFDPWVEPVDKMNLDFNAFQWAKEMTRRKSITFLRNNKIKFLDKKFSHDEGAWELETEGGVRLFYANEESPDIYVLKRFEKVVEDYS